MENDGVRRDPLEVRAVNVKRRLKKFGVFWVALYIVMTGWLFHALTGNEMTNPIIGNTFIAVPVYGLWLTGKYYWHKNNLAGHVAVKDVVAWVSEVSKGGLS